MYQEISAFRITLLLSLVSLSGFGDLGICNMIPKGSTQDITSKNENLGEKKSQIDNSDKDNKKDSKGGNKRKIEGSNLDKNPKKRIRTVEPVKDAAWWADFQFFCHN